MRFMRHLEYFAFLLFSVTMQCQPKLCVGQIPVMDGYAVTNDHDTIPGKVEYVSRILFENKLVFVKNDSDMISVFRPSAISGLYSYSGIAFESKELDGRRVFLRLLSKGSVNLYSDGKDIFLSNGPDNVIRLRGGDETVIIDGKAYVQSVKAYRTQIISQVAEPSFHAKIAVLPFKQKAVLNLIREVNKDFTVPPQPRLYNQGYFSFEAGYSLNMMKKLFQPDDDLAEYKRHRTKSWVAGFRYKRKILTTRSHVGVGLHFEHTPKMTERETKVLYSKITVPADGGSYPSDPTGSQEDVYSYELNSTDLSVAFVPEVSNGRFRPFLDVGIVSKFYMTRDASLNRKLYDENGTLTMETDIPIEVRSVILGPRLGSGVRFIVDMNRSLSAGFNTEVFWISNGHLDAMKIVSKQFYLSYGF